MKSEIIKHIEYLTGNSIKFKEIEDRYSIAVNKWFLCGGELRSNEIANYLDINHNKLTLLIQKRMSKITGVKLKDESPVVEVMYTPSSLERLYPKSYRYEWLPVYELNYYIYLANNSRSQLIHNYKLFLNESRSRDLQSHSKVSKHQTPKGNIQI
jgi:hypothetical protein